MDLNEFAKWAKNKHGFDCNELKFCSTALIVVYQEFTDSGFNKNLENSESQYLDFFKYYLEKLKEYLKLIPTNPLEDTPVVNGVDISGMYFFKSELSAKISMLLMLI